MAIREYIGARYVPRFLGTYDPTTIYEALDVVDNGMGTSYIAKKPVPAGTPLNDLTYWALYGSTNGAIINLQNQIDTINNTDLPPLQSGVAASNFLVNSAPVNVLTLGIKNDGSEDISTLVNQYTLQFPLYFPAGIYRVEHPLKLANSIMGAVYGRQGWDGVALFDSQINLPTPTGDAVIMEDAANVGSSLSISNIFIRCNGGREDGIRLINTRTVAIYLSHINVFNCASDAIRIKGVPGNSRCVEMNHISIWGSNPAYYDTARGVILEADTYDSVLNDISIIGVGYAMFLFGGLYYASNVHIFSNMMNGTPTASQFESRSIGIQLNNNSKFYGTNIYLDSCYRAIYADGNAQVSIKNIMAYWDNLPTGYAGNINFVAGSASPNMIFDGGIISAPSTAHINSGNPIFKNVKLLLTNTSAVNAKEMLYADSGLAYDAGGAAGEERYKRCALIYVEYNGQCVINCYTALDSNATIYFNKYGNNAPTIKKILNSTSCDIYYKEIANNIYEIYIDATAAPFDVGSSVISSSKGVHVIDLMNTRDNAGAPIPIITQANTTGLVAIS